MEILLAIATILGGIAAVWYFWEKWDSQKARPKAPKAARAGAVVHAQARAFGVLMGEDAATARAALIRMQALVANTLQAHGGNVLSQRCDSLTASFEDAAEAVDGAASALNAVKGSNRDTAVSERVHYRFGIDAVTGNPGMAAAAKRAASLACGATPDGIRISEALRATLPEEGTVLSLAASGPGVYSVLSGSENAASRSLPVQLEGLEVPLPSRPSIVLMPFTVTDDDDSQARALASGLRLDIQNALVKTSGLFLIASGAGNAFRGVPAAEAAQRLGVRHALEGNVQHAGERVRVHVQLVDTQEDRVVWSERYDRDLGGFAIQDEITERIVTALDVKLASGEQARVWRKCLTEPKARDHYYSGMLDYFQMKAETVASARAHFERLAEVAPESPHGPTMVAFCLWLESTRGWAKDAVAAREQAGKWAERATAFEDADGQAHTVLGNVRLLQQRHDEALQIAREATERRPNCTNANGFLANVLLYCGDPSEAADRVRRAIRYSPVYPPWFVEILAAAYRDSGQSELSAAAARELLRVVPGSLEARVILAGALAQSGALEEARNIVAEVLERNPQFSSRAYAEKLPYRDESRREKIIAELERAGLPA